MADIRSKLKDVSQIPTLPESVEYVLKAMRDPRVSAKDITEVISKDVAMSSKLLKVVNSAYYGYRGNITSVTHAIVMLGFSAVKNLILGLAVSSLMGNVKSSPEFDLKEFWLHCIGVGSTAKVIARRMGFREDEEFFIYGLLHDVGKILFYQLDKDRFLELLKDAHAGKRPFWQIELEQDVFPHTAIGYELFTFWKMPERLVNVVAYHHDWETSENNKEVRVIWLADVLTRMFSVGENGAGNFVDDNEMARIRELFPDALEEESDLRDEIDEEIKKGEVFLEILRRGGA